MPQGGDRRLLAADHDAWTVEDWQALFEQHASIAEFGRGRSREQAKAAAFEACVAEWLNRHPCRLDPGRLRRSGEPDREGHAVVPFGTERQGHMWLHPECWRDWPFGRRAEAIRALSAMGLTASTGPEGGLRNGKEERGDQEAERKRGSAAGAARRGAFRHDREGGCYVRRSRRR